MPSPIPDHASNGTVPDPATPPSSGWRKTSPRRLLAVLGALGMVMVATPLAEVLLRQSEDLARLQDATQRIVPLQANVGVQRALLDHQFLASATLGGQPEREAERQTQQAVVGVRIDTLHLALTQAHEPEAMGEHDALREDWRVLASRLEARRIDADTSQRSHRLLIDQSIQIGDLLVGWPGQSTVTGEAGGSADLRRRAAATSRLAWQALPRLEHAIAGMGTDGPAPGELLAVLRSSWRQVQRLAAAGQDPAAPELERALRPWLAEVPGQHEAAPAADLGALAPARQAVRAWADRAQQAAAVERARAAAQAEATLSLTTAGAALGLLAYVLLAWAVARRLRRIDPGGFPPAPQAEGAEGAPADASTPRSEAARLLGRLRDAQAGGWSGTHRGRRRGSASPQDTDR